MRKRARRGSWVAVIFWSLLCLASAGLWLRSRSTADEIAWTHTESRQQLISAEGRLIFDGISITSPTWRMESSLRHHDVAIPPGRSYARGFMESSGEGFYFDAAGFALTHARRTPAATSRAMSIPIWLLVAATGLMTLRALARARRGGPPGYCPECGFNLATSDTTCPKCGAAIAANKV